ncbi:unnamed protein product, partial [Amoebophrya sp. A120]|eukprot:GSA120T00022342001.1
MRKQQLRGRKIPLQYRTLLEIEEKVDFVVSEVLLRKIVAFLIFHDSRAPPAGRSGENIPSAQEVRVVEGVEVDPDADDPDAVVVSNNVDGNEVQYASASMITGPPPRRTRVEGDPDHHAQQPTSTSTTSSAAHLLHRKRRHLVKLLDHHHHNKHNNNHRNNRTRRHGTMMNKGKDGLDEAGEENGESLHEQQGTRKKTSLFDKQVRAICKMLFFAERLQPRYLSHVVAKKKEKTSKDEHVQAASTSQKTGEQHRAGDDDINQLTTDDNVLVAPGEGEKKSGSSPSATFPPAAGLEVVNGEGSKRTQQDKQQEGGPLVTAKTKRQEPTAKIEVDAAAKTSATKVAVVKAAKGKAKAVATRRKRSSSSSSSSSSGSSSSSSGSSSSSSSSSGSSSSSSSSSGSSSSSS